MIRVVCNDKAHPRQTVTIAEFFSRQPGSWELVVHREGRAAEMDRETPRLAQIVDPTAPGMRRSRYRLECPACGLNATAGEAALEPALDTLAAHGVESISLQGLAARVSKQ